MAEPHGARAGRTPVTPGGLARIEAFRLAALTLAATVLLAILQYLPVPSRTQWWKTVYDAGHAPLFGLLALVFLGISLTVPGWRDRPRWRHYAVAVAVAAVVGLLTELSQLPAARDADPWDMARNLVGAAAFLTFASTFDAELAPSMASPTVPVRGLLRVGAVVLLGLVFVPVAATGVAYLSRNAAFPRICSFQSYWESFFLETSKLRLTLSYLPERLRDDDLDNLVGRLEFFAGPGNRLALVEPYPDWSGYETFAFELYSPLDHPVEVALRIDDAEHGQTARDRFQRRITVAPGRNEIRIPLDEVRAAPESRAMEMDRIRKVIVFAANPPEPFTLYLDEIRLE